MYVSIYFSPLQLTHGMCQYTVPYVDYVVHTHSDILHHNPMYIALIFVCVFSTVILCMISTSRTVYICCYAIISISCTAYR